MRTASERCWQAKLESTGKAGCGPMAGWSERTFTARKPIKPTRISNPIPTPNPIRFHDFILIPFYMGILNGKTFNAPKNKNHFQEKEIWRQTDDIKRGNCVK
jgi:hypothetical protein